MKRTPLSLPIAPRSPRSARTAAAPAAERTRAPLIDGCGRRIDHLRLSVTDACNLRCSYCRPGAARLEAGCASLDDDARIELIRFLHSRYGLKQVRLTGGEPLIHRSIVALTSRIARIDASISLAMTTNGLLLPVLAGLLRSAGLQRLNVSLDTLNPVRYHDLTGGRLADVLDGLTAARKAGFPPPRVNCVVLRGVNDEELVAMARFGLQENLEIRFLEAMPIGPAASYNRRHFVSGPQVRSILARSLVLHPIERTPGETAQRYRFVCSDGEGTLGIIAPLSESFCAQCRRIRVTARGLLYPCLLDDRCVDLKVAWADGRLDESCAADLIEEAVAHKRPTGAAAQSAAMIGLGG